jgi:hypothetical protein
MSSHQLTYLPTFELTYKHVYLPIHPPTHSPTYPPIYLLIYLPTYLPTHLLFTWSINIYQCMIYKIWKYSIKLINNHFNHIWPLDVDKW